MVYDNRHRSDLINPALIYCRTCVQFKAYSTRRAKGAGGRNKETNAIYVWIHKIREHNAITIDRLLFSKWNGLNVAKVPCKIGSQSDALLSETVFCLSFVVILHYILFFFIRIRIEKYVKLTSSTSIWTNCANPNGFVGAGVVVINNAFSTTLLLHTSWIMQYTLYYKFFSSSSEFSNKTIQLNERHLGICSNYIICLRFNMAEITGYLAVLLNL